MVPGLFLNNRTNFFYLMLTVMVRWLNLTHGWMCKQDNDLKYRQSRSDKRDYH